MASNTKATWNRRDRHHVNEGKRRKARESKKSTPSNAELFAGMGEPGQKATTAAPTTKAAK